jgi:acyl-CoA thioesterase-1
VQVMKIRTLAVVVGFFVAAFATGALSESAHAQILALGGSNVEGTGVSSGEAFPEQLQGMLRAKGKSYSVRASGVYGDTTHDILARLDSAVPAGTRIVILLVGGNDVLRGGTVAQARAGVREIIQRLQAKGIRVINAFPILRAAMARGLMQSDHIHLSPEGHRYLASRLAASIN